MAGNSAARAGVVASQSPGLVIQIVSPDAMKVAPAIEHDCER